MTTAFVLSGGGSLGAMQVGMLRALLRAGIRPDLVYGTSIGALNGASLAADPTPAGVERLASVWHQVGQHDVYPLDPHQVLRAFVRSLPWVPIGLLRATGALNDAFPIRPLAGLLGILGRSDHVVPSGPRTRLLHRVLSQAGISTLEQMRVPVEIETTEVTSGRLVPLWRGDALSALLASSAIPGVFAPVQVGPSILMDGGVSDNTALDRAIEAGADEVYVLPTGFACDLDDPPRTALGMAVHALTVLIEQRLIAAIARHDPRSIVHVVPPLCPLDVVPVDFGHTDALIARATEATTQWLHNGREPVPGLSRSLGAHGASGVLDLTAAGLGQPGSHHPG